MTPHAQSRNVWNETGSATIRPSAGATFSRWRNCDASRGAWTMHARCWSMRPDFQREAREHAARARTALALSLVLKQLGRLRSAEDAARDALVLDTDIDVVRGALNQLDQIAVAYGGRQDWDEAERVELDAALIRDEILPDLATVSQYLALARTSLDSGAFQRVRELCHDVLKLAEDLDAWRQSAEAFELLGHALKEQDKGVLAIDRYREGITYARRCGECALLARLQDHVTNVSNSDTLVLKEDSDGSNARKPTGPTTRFEPLPP